jgi:hypothetical protein
MANTAIESKSHVTEAPQAHDMWAEWKPFAWWGIALEVPAAWSPGRLVGTAREGRAQLDDGEMERLDLTWKVQRRGLMHRLLERHLRQVEEAAPKGEGRIRIERNRPLPVDVGGDAEYFVWRTRDAEAHNLVVETQERRPRVIFMRIVGRGKERIAKTARRVMGSVVIAPGGRERRWSVFGLDVTLPGELELARSAFVTGRSRMEFARFERRLIVQKFSMGRTLLGEQTLRRWALETFRKELRGFRLEFDDQGGSDHPGLVIRGGHRFPVTRWLGMGHLRWTGWFCAPENKIVAVIDRFRGRAGPLPLVARVGCCAAGPESWLR